MSCFLEMVGAIDWETDAPSDNLHSKLFVFVFGVSMIAWVIIRIRVKIRRFHDKDKSGLWVLITFIPILGNIFELISLGFLEGTVGPNRYGDDPVSRDVSGN